MKNLKRKHPVLYEILSVSLCLFCFSLITIIAEIIIGGTSRDTTYEIYTSADRIDESHWQRTETLENVDNVNQYRIYEEPIEGYTIDATESNPALIVRNGDNNFTATITNTASFKVVQYDANGGSGTVPQDQRIDGTGNTQRNSIVKANDVETFTVSYNMNGSSSAAPADQTATKTSVYSANGWNTLADGSGISYGDLAPIAPSTQKTTLYAQFVPTSSTTSIVLATPAEREDYLFRGWYGDETCTQLIGLNGESYTPTTSKTLYAKWELNAYDVVYNANGGSGEPSTQKKIHNTDLILSSTVPTKANDVVSLTTNFSAGDHGTSTGAVNDEISSNKTTSYTFNNWISSYDSKTYSPGDTYSENAATTMTASYTNTVLYDSITLPTPIGSSGYSLNGWFLGNVKIGIAGDSYTPNLDNQTLTAHWLKQNILSISNNVTGNMGNQVKRFEYTITLSNTNTSYSDKTIIYNINNGTSKTMTLDSNGQGTFTLQSGDTINLLDILEETDYTITQENYETDGYTTDNLVSSGSISTSNVLATFTNDRKIADVPTGIQSQGILLSITIVVLGLFGILWFLINREIVSTKK